MADKKRINLVVNTDTKARWKGTVEESVDYKDLSDLIRKSVEHEIAGDHEPTQNPEEPTSAPTQPGVDALKEVTDALGRIESSLQDLNQRVADVEKEVGTSGEAYDLQNAIFEILPTPPAHGPHDRPPVSEWAISLEDLADDLGVSEAETEDAVAHLMDMTKTVKRDTDDHGEPHFYREGE